MRPAVSKTARRSALPSKFLQSRHLQASLHRTLAWKHSQYFFKHPDFLQWHPFVCLPGNGSPGSTPPASRGTVLLIFGLNAEGFLSNVEATAFWTMSSCSLLLQHPTQLHPSQNTPAAKHSQYNFKHFEFLQLHCFRLGASGRNTGDVDCERLEEKEGLFSRSAL